MGSVVTAGVRAASVIVCTILPPKRSCAAPALGASARWGVMNVCRG